MSVVDSRYNKLCPQRGILQDEVVLAQAWKKTHTFIRRYNWYADVLELDASAICLSSNLAAWSDAIASGDYETSPAWLVPAPKNGLWCFRSEDDGGWQPRVPVLQVSHDWEGDWQFLDATTEQPEDCVILCLGCVYEKDQTLSQIADLPAGWSAWRTQVGGAWERGENPPYDESDDE